MLFRFDSCIFSPSPAFDRPDPMNSQTGPEPDKYTMEEMMERLRQNSSGSSDGEPQLVTREDGTQMMRVRRRKRRSRQKHKEKEQRDRKIRVWQIIGGFCLVVGVGFTLLAMLWYFNSRPYYKKTEERISSATGAKVALEQFRMNPIGASAITAELTWPEGNVLKSLQGTYITAPLLPSSFFLSKWQGEEVSLKTAHVRIGAPVAGAPVVNTSGVGDGFDYRFERYVCENLTVDFGKDLPPFLRYTDGAGSFRYQGERAQIRLDGGKWQMVSWLPLEVDRGMIEVENGRVFLHGLNFRSGNGKARIEGEIMADRSAQATLKLSAEALPGEVLMGSHLSRVFQAHLTGEGVIELPASPARDYRVTLDFKDAHVNSSTSLSGFPFQEILKKELQDVRFTRLDFNSESSGTLLRDINGVKVEELRLAANGLLAVRGNLAVGANGALSGQLLVGVDERMLFAQDNKALKAVFTETQDGFAWAPVRVSGDVEHPQDDLAAKVQASGHKLGETNLPKKSNEQEFFDLINNR